MLQRTSTRYQEHYDVISFGIIYLFACWPHQNTCCSYRNGRKSSEESSRTARIVPSVHVSWPLSSARRRRLPSSRRPWIVREVTTSHANQARIRSTLYTAAKTGLSIRIICSSARMPTHIWQRDFGILHERTTRQDSHKSCVPR